MLSHVWRVCAAACATHGGRSAAHLGLLGDVGQLARAVLEGASDAQVGGAADGAAQVVGGQQRVHHVELPHRERPRLAAQGRQLRAGGGSGPEAIVVGVLSRDKSCDLQDETGAVDAVH